MSIVSPADLFGKILTMDSGNFAESCQACIVEMIENYQDVVDYNLENVMFRCSVGNDKYKETVAYINLLKYKSKVGNDPVVWKLKQIMGHKGRLTPSHPNWKISNTMSR